VTEPLGVLLAGGSSRRMGTDKPLVELAGRPLLHYPLAALEAVLTEVVVVCKEHTPLPDVAGRAAIWCEPEPDRHHPLLGVRAALRSAPGRAVLVVAGDLPLVAPDDLRALLAGGAGRTVVARAAGRLQPLLARYPPGALAVLDAMAPDEAATDVVMRLEPLIVDLGERAAFNVNVPEDLLQASALLDGQPNVNE
jgi:molybdopterin-guanine dinucleotide biosynthesis protein A